MSWIDFESEKIEWEHQKKRADFFGKTNYSEMCKAECDNLELLFPELVAVKCNCLNCVNNNFIA